MVATALDTIDKSRDTLGSNAADLRNRVHDQILREALMTVSSDWAFMVSKDTAAGYARERAHKHAHATREIAAAVAEGRDSAAARLADAWNRADNLFPGLDARRLPGRHGGPL